MGKKIRPMKKKKVAIISPAAQKPDSISEMLTPILSEQEISVAAHLSFTGTQMNTEDTRIRPGHIFSHVDKDYNKIVITDSYPALYANYFTTCWLVLTLYDMGPDSSVFIEIQNNAAKEKKGHITIDYLTKTCPGIKHKQLTDSWHQLQWSSDLNDKALKLSTTYKYFHRGFQKFKQGLLESFNGEEVTADRALSTYLYSLFGANQKSYIYQTLVNQYFPNLQINGYDLGGGYGCMAAELAAMGHNMHVLDYNEHHVRMGKWLIEHCHLHNRLTIEKGNIADISSVRNHYHVISYFGCLLYVDRKDMPRIFQESMRLLKPGGLLLVHENPKEAGKPGSQDYDERFTASELLDLIQENAGEPEFRNMFTAAKMTWEAVKDKVIMAVVKKSD